MWKKEIIEVSDLHQQKNRSKGLHVTDVLRSLLDERRSKITGPIRNSHSNYALMGRLYEYGYVEGLKRDYPGEYRECKEGCKDGLFYTPDLWQPSCNRVTEVKTTWSTLDEELGIESETFWYHQAQLKAYCLAEGTCHGAIDILPIRSHPPEIIRFSKEFTPLELIRNWEMIQFHAKQMRKQGHGLD